MLRGAHRHAASTYPVCRILRSPEPNAGHPFSLDAFAHTCWATVAQLRDRAPDAVGQRVRVPEQLGGTRTTDPATCGLAEIGQYVWTAGRTAAKLPGAHRVASNPALRTPADQLSGSWHCALAIIPSATTVGPNCARSWAEVYGFVQSICRPGQKARPATQRKLPCRNLIGKPWNTRSATSRAASRSLRRMRALRSRPGSRRQPSPAFRRRPPREHRYRRTPWVWWL
jgi:hypothetical protein